MVQLALEEVGVEELRHIQKQLGGLGCRGHFHRRQCRGLERLAKQTPAGERKVKERHQAVLDNWREPFHDCWASPNSS